MAGNLTTPPPTAQQPSSSSSSAAGTAPLNALIVPPPPEPIHPRPPAARQTKWMMGVLTPSTISAVTHTPEGDEMEALVDSGAGVSAAPPILSEHALGPVEFPEERPWMQTVDGTGLDYFGRGHLPFAILGSEGNVVQGQLQAEFTNVDRVVLSCGQMATLGTGSWFPS